GSRALEIYTQYHWEKDDLCWESVSEPRSVGTEERNKGELGVEDNPVHPQVKDESSSEDNFDEGVRRKLGGLVITLQIEGVSSPLALTCIPSSVSGYRETAKWLGLTPTLSQSYADATRIKWMTDRLKECAQHNHGRIDEQFIPRRLIDTRGSNLRLVERHDIQNSHTTYAALSYCWGSADDANLQLKTTTASLEERKLKIGIESLTPVLKDAVFLANTLSIPYLWVDSLCILQDDISDWERQCVEVATLYNSALVTFCAASSTSCLEGFLRQRGLRVRLQFESARNPPVTGHFDLQVRYAFHEHMDSIDCRWKRRGWTFQEARASTCQLIFGNSNIHLHCPDRSKTMGYNVPPSHRLVTPGEWTGFGLRETHALRYRTWSSVLQMYSLFDARSFTKATDILPALSGLAAQYQGFLKDAYLAGLWRRDLHLGLLWRS
ncbi:heterokaryon incompatibility protein-domain-containing protein, partial [Podospora aff. communis PSN243]